MPQPGPVESRSRPGLRPTDRPLPRRSTEPPELASANSTMAALASLSHTAHQELEPPCGSSGSPHGGTTEPRCGSRPARVLLRTRVRSLLSAAVGR
ncbi:hypothetical protein EYF80_067044 [Liparis tanakae]|uniref:Uncharacterized protein n=1 Tax=Liparis tanakae TaxID=230148 RepID=A0A4Z2E260_9TELE|nr:hypothetical protein EYF80_067044 [Liparis tanakae]